MLELRSNIYITISISSHFKVCSFIFKVFLIKLKKHKNLSLNLSKFLHIKTNIQTSYEWFSVGFPFSGVFSYPSATPPPCDYTVTSHQRAACCRRSMTSYCLRRLTKMQVTSCNWGGSRSTCSHVCMTSQINVLLTSWLMFSEISFNLRFFQKTPDSLDFFMSI